MKKRKTVITGALIITIIIVGVLLGGVILENHIEDQFHNRKIGSYRFKTEVLDVNIFLRRMTIEDAAIEDSTADQYYTVPKIRVTGIRILPYILNNELIINKLNIQNPEVIVALDKSEDKNPTDGNDSPEQEREIKQICIRNLEIEDASVLLKKQVSESTDTLFSFKSDLKIQNLNIFSDRQKLKLNSHSAEKFEVQLTNGVFNFPGGLYKLQFESLNFNTEQKIVNFGNIHFSSHYPKYEIAQKTGVETDWYNIILEQLDVKDININTLLQDTAIVLGSIVINGLDATIFRDKRPPFPDKPDSKLPMQMLESLPVPVSSDSILIKNGSVVYQEHAEKSSETGMVSFNRLYASIYNLGTLQDSIDGQTSMSVRALVMNEALLKAEFIFPNNVYSHQYQVSGSMDPVNATAFNPMLIPAAFVRVEKGRIKRLNFDFTYDNSNSEGNLALEYENLNISLLDKEDGSEKTIKTFLTETFILQEDNLQEENSYQKGTISFERDKKKSIFNYWWKSLFSGIKDIMAF